MTRSRPVARSALACLLVGLSACSTRGTGTVTRSSPSPAAASSPSAIPALWALHQDYPQGFAIALPDAWDLAIRDSPTLDADLNAVSDHSLELVTYFREALNSDPQLRLIAADSRGLPDGFATNVNVMTEDVGVTGTAPTLDELAAAKVKRVRAEPGVTGTVKRVSDRLAGHPAARLDYSLNAPGDKAIRVRTYMTIVPRGREEFLYVLTMGEPSDAGASIFGDIAGLFTIFPPPRPAASPASNSPAPGGGSPTPG